MADPSWNTLYTVEIRAHYLSNTILERYSYTNVNSSIFRTDAQRQRLVLPTFRDSLKSRMLHSVLQVI
jgi:hypothetical protein